MFIDFIASLAVFAALVLGLLVIFSRETAGGGVEARVRNLAGSRLRSTELPRVAFAQRFFGPVMTTSVRTVVAVMPTRWLTWVERKLVVAGRPMSTNTYLGFVLVLATGIPVGYFVLVWGATQGSPPGQLLAILPVVVAFAVLLPVIWLRRVARARQMRIWRSLPDAFDLITTCVEAGLSLDAAFQKVAEKFKGPFGDEVGQMLREIALGKTRRAALTDLSDRLDVTDLTVFATAVIQSEQLGTSLAQVLRVQASQIRMRRRQRAEQIARQAPAKMAFPLVLCLMPAFFIVVVGPVFVRIVHFLNQ